MKAHLKRLGKSTFIYSSGQMLSRMITFFLLPITTSYLTPKDFGVIGSLAILTQFVNGLFSLGFGVSLSRAYWSTEDRKEKDGIIWTGFFTLLLNCASWIGCAYLFSPYLSYLFLGVYDYPSLIVISLSTVALSCAILPFSSYLRMEEKAFTVVALSLVEVGLTVSLSLYLVVAKQWGVYGVFVGGLLAQVVNFCLMVATCARKLQFTFALHRLREIFKVGFPYIFSLGGYFLMQSSARYFLQTFQSLDEVGLFFMAFNFGRILELVVTGFISAWPPFFTSFINKQEEAIILFGKVLSYYSMGLCALAACFFAFAKLVVTFWINPAFSEIWLYVGPLSLIPMLWGMYGISATGIIFRKKSGTQVLMETFSGLLCVGLNIALIPFFSKAGAAAATLLSFAFLNALSFYINQSLLPVRYEIPRLIKIFIGLFGVAICSYLPVDNLLPYMGVTLSALALYFFFLWEGCLESSEKEALLSKLRSLVFSKLERQVR